jgi:hypothetical protein
MKICNGGINNPNYGKKASEETRKKISNANSGIKHGAAKAIILIHYNNNEEYFGCISDACRKYNLQAASITRLCNKRQHYHKGYKARYA